MSGNSGNARVADVMALAVERKFAFDDWEPRGVPGFQSNIAEIFHCSENQTTKLLEAVDIVAEDPHFEVHREPIQPSISGSKGKSYPKKIRVTVSPA